MNQNLQVNKNKYSRKGLLLRVSELVKVTIDKRSDYYYNVIQRNIRILFYLTNLYT